MFILVVVAGSGLSYLLLGWFVANWTTRDYSTNEDEFVFDFIAVMLIWPLFVLGGMIPAALN